MEESLATLSILEENLKKTDELTSKMVGILTTVFDARLGKLEENIKPMYNTTRNLTQISQSTKVFGIRVDIDINATISAMDKMRNNFDSVPHEEVIIKAGFAILSRITDISPKQNIHEYLGSIERLQNSINSLSRSNILSADTVQAQMVSYPGEYLIRSN